MRWHSLVHGRQRREPQLRPEVVQTPHASGLQCTSGLLNDAADVLRSHAGNRCCTIHQQSGIRLAGNQQPFMKSILSSGHQFPGLHLGLLHTCTSNKQHRVRSHLMLAQRPLHARGERH